MKQWWWWRTWINENQITCNTHRINQQSIAGLILGLRPANARRRYFVTTSHIGRSQALFYLVWEQRKHHSSASLVFFMWIPITNCQLCGSVLMQWRHHAYRDMLKMWTHQRVIFTQRFALIACKNVVYKSWSRLCRELCHDGPELGRYRNDVGSIGPTLSDVFIVSWWRHEWKRFPHYWPFVRWIHWQRGGG